VPRGPAQMVGEPFRLGPSGEVLSQAFARYSKLGAERVDAIDSEPAPCITEGPIAFANPGPSVRSGFWPPGQHVVFSR